MNDTAFPDEALERILAAAAKILLAQDLWLAATIMSENEVSVRLYDHDNWNGGQDTWELQILIDPDEYISLDNRNSIEIFINNALKTVMSAYSSSDFMQATIQTRLKHDPDWRLKVRRVVSGSNINNQGRVRSNRPAFIECDGLRFRSKPEVEFYKALKKTGIPFAPLSVVIHGGIEYRRIEPDFIIYKNGTGMVVEIDGDSFHRESPVDAFERLKFLRDEGLCIERVEASTCDTPEKAREAVQRVLASFKKILQAR